MKNKYFILSFFVFLASCAGSDTTQDYPQAAPQKEYPLNEPFEILGDRVNQGTDKSAWAVNRNEIHSTYSQVEHTWTLTKDLSGLPVFSAPNMPIVEAVTNLALEESLKNIIPSGTNTGAFMAGEKWPGTWTRDISYSIHLSLAMILPGASEKSLRVKVNTLPEVIQDTGTGGSWPVSTDRTVWSLAAWEIYLSTGNRPWLDYAYEVLKNTASRDRTFAWDAPSGLYRGETSFMDWREQTYPKWMTPVDIAESKALGTTLLHIQTLRILERMGTEKGVGRAEIAQWKTWADQAQAAVNRLWLPEQEYYSAYEYGPWQGGLKTDKSDTLANSLGVLLNIFPAQRATQLMAKLPVVHFGPPIIYPQIPHISNYHNKGIWPFVTAYYGWAAADAGNLAAEGFAIRSNLRAAALFLTHKENFVFDNGHFRGTQVNSDRQLWSVAGWLSQVYRGLIGIRLESAGLRLRPSVPGGIAGPFTLTGFPYRNAKLNITVNGSGNRVTSLKVDGTERGANFLLPPNTTGVVNIVIELSEPDNTGAYNLVDTSATGTRETTASAEILGNGTSVSWEATGYDIPFRVFRRNEIVQTSKGTQVVLPTQGLSAQAYSVQGAPEDGFVSNLSNYALVFPEGTRVAVQAETGKFREGTLVVPEEDMGQEGSYVDMEGVPGESLELRLRVPATGTWALRFKYANGNGPISTENKCAIRTLEVDGRVVGKILLPQTGNWSDWMKSTAVFLNLSAGEHTVKLNFQAEDSNMNGVTNQAIVDYLEAIKW